MINRLIAGKILSRLGDSKIHVVFGPRQSGKTTLVRAVQQQSGLKTFWLNCDEADIQMLLREPTSTRLKAFLGDAQLVVFDEAQRVGTIGMCLKLLIDNYPDLRIIATGSSAFEMANRVNEALTGRKWEYVLLPFSFAETSSAWSVLEEKRLLHHRLTFGAYPEVVMSRGHEREILMQLAGSYLYKDIFALERIQKSENLVRLVSALALQISSEVSYHELGQIAGLDLATVRKYIALLEKSFVVFRLSSFARNVRNELKKSRKVYFWDVGIRNAIINNFSDPAVRDDAGKLWENYLVSERIKRNGYADHFCNHYFWRTTQQQEIDYIEEYDGQLHAFEFKWNPDKKAKIPKTFTGAYPGTDIAVITPRNHEEFLL